MAQTVRVGVIASSDFPHCFGFRASDFVLHLSSSTDLSGVTAVPGIEIASEPSFRGNVPRRLVSIKGTFTEASYAEEA